MTGYGRGESERGGAKITVEINAVNRRQSDIVINLPRDLSALEPRVRQTVADRLTRGRTNVVVGFAPSASAPRKLGLDHALARSYHQDMRALQAELSVPGEINIGMILQAPGVMRFSENGIEPNEVWPAVKQALGNALGELIKMREREGKHLAKDLIQRLKVVRQSLKEVKKMYPVVAEKYRETLLERIRKAGFDSSLTTSGSSVAFFADRSDVRKLTRLESHLAQFAHHLRKDEPVGALEFIVQEFHAS